MYFIFFIDIHRLVYKIFFYILLYMDVYDIDYEQCIILQYGDDGFPDDNDDSDDSDDSDGEHVISKL